MNATQYANELHSIWQRFGDEECAEQIEAHMESEGFSFEEIITQLERLNLAEYEYKQVILEAA